MEYEKCLVELDEVLNHLDKEFLEKIPDDVRKAITAKKNKEYIWKYDEDKELGAQNLDRKTIVMLSYLNMEYLLNAEQRELMKEIHRENERQVERKKQSEYNNFSNIVKEEKIVRNEKIVQNEEKEMIEVKPQKWYEKIFSLIKSVFKKGEQ